MSAPDALVLSCGCFLCCVVTSAGERELRVSPCRSDCRNLALAIEMSVGEGKPVEFRRAT